MISGRTMEQYTAILHEELVLATGCTEPIALAYCAAQLRKLLGALPERVEAVVSGNILKNVKSVVVPNTGGAKGVEAAIAAGLVAGDPEQELQVIAQVDEDDQPAIAAYLADKPIAVSCATTPCQLDILLRGTAGTHSAAVRIANSHANLVYLERDGEILRNLPVSASPEENLTDKRCLNVADIFEYAGTVPLETIHPMIARQLRYNCAIADEGMAHGWGAQIGRILQAEYGGEIKQEARAYAAAASDARMSGCEQPVVILSGSGNQGITASVPIARYARHFDLPEERLLRAVALSDLITLHQKTGIGRLSAYCGAVSAGVGAGAGICYLLGGDLTAVAHTVVNAVAILSGTVCDGAKPSCAAKIAAAVDAGILGYEMYRHSSQFRDGEGIVAKGVDRTIANVGMLAREGMYETDRTILRIMTGDGSC